MKTNEKNAGLKVKTSIKAGGGGPWNHNRNGLRVKTAIKAGEVSPMLNHNARLLAAR